MLVMFRGEVVDGLVVDNRELDVGGQQQFADLGLRCRASLVREFLHFLGFDIRCTNDTRNGAGQFPIRNLPRHQLLKRVRNEHVIGCFVVLIPIVW